MVRSDRGYQFETTGREFYANFYIGIGESTEGLEIAQGYDGSININLAYGDEEYEETELKDEERKELADYMINLWTKFKNGDNSK